MLIHRIRCHHIYKQSRKQLQHLQRIEAEQKTTTDYSSANIVNIKTVTRFNETAPATRHVRISRGASVCAMTSTVLRNVGQTEPEAPPTSAQILRIIRDELQNHQNTLEWLFTSALTQCDTVTRLKMLPPVAWMVLVWQFLWGFLVVLWHAISFQQVLWTLPLILKLPFR